MMPRCDVESRHDVWRLMSFSHGQFLWNSTNKLHAAHLRLESKLPMYGPKFDLQNYANTPAGNVNRKYKLLLIHALCPRIWILCIHISCILINYSEKRMEIDTFSCWFPPRRAITFMEYACIHSGSTNSDRNKMTNIFHTASSIFANENSRISIKLSLQFPLCNWQYASIDLGNGLVPNRLQTITWKNDDPVYWQKYASLI